MGGVSGNVKLIHPSLTSGLRTSLVTEMIKKEGSMEIKILHRQGVGIREIARQMGISHNTVRIYLRTEATALLGPAAAPRQVRFLQGLSPGTDRTRQAGLDSGHSA